MIARIPETKKKPGVCYAPTDDGVELPVIDITHPAFALELSGEDLAKRTEAYIREQDRWERFPSFLRAVVARYFQKHSILARGGTGADGALLSGMSTYLMKLGPDNLAQGPRAPSTARSRRRSPRPAFASASGTWRGCSPTRSSRRSNRETAP